MKRKMAFSLFVVAGGLLTIMVTQRGIAAPPAKVLICHVDPDCDGIGPEVIEVSERSLSAHEAHGDCLAPEGALAGDACPGLEDSGCDYPECENDILPGDEGDDEEEPEDEEACDEEDEPDCDQEDRVTLCHIPPGNPSKAKTIAVCEQCVPDHLGHGDLLGSCEETANAKAINGMAGGDVGFDTPGSACGGLGMLTLSLGLVGIGGLRVRRKRYFK